MSWTDYHRRAEVLRAVIEHAESRRDGDLPMDLPGVREHFADEQDLVAALLLRWHSRLSGNLERALMGEPLPVEDAVVRAWRTTADQMPGLRALIDHQLAEPASSALAESLAVARQREWQHLALAAGLASVPDHAAAAVGRSLEERARRQPSSATPVPQARHEGPETVAPRADFVRRLRAALVA